MTASSQELLEDGSSAAPLASSGPRLKHVKRKTDNLQSKGRKLSYDPQPKLQNFMFPEIPSRPIILSELFSSVFGQRTSAAAAAAAAAAPPAAKVGKATRVDKAATLTVGNPEVAEVEIAPGSLFG